MWSFCPLFTHAYRFPHFLPAIVSCTPRLCRFIFWTLHSLFFSPCPTYSVRPHRVLAFSFFQFISCWLFFFLSSIPFFVSLASRPLPNSAVLFGPPPTKSSWLLHSPYSSPQLFLLTLVFFFLPTRSPRALLYSSIYFLSRQHIPPSFFMAAALK